jgi:ferredoxin-NADP reductase/DMSO/TMAO reductase YedYZ heme-binding membrane subunit
MARPRRGTSAVRGPMLGMTAEAVGPAERLALLAVAAGAVAILALWWGATARLAGAGTGEAITAVGRVTGLLGAYLSLVVLVLMARIPWLERGIGLVRLASWHRYAGSTALVLIGVHVVTTTWGYAVVDHTRVGHEIGAILDLPGMIRATVATALLVALSLTSAAGLRRRLPFGAWWLLHLSAYVAIVLGFAHQLDTGDDFVGREGAAAVWRWVVIAVLAAVAWWRFAKPLAEAWARRTRVAAVEPAGGGVSVWFAGDGPSRRAIRGGGFVLVRFLGRGLWATARPYTVTEVADGDRFRIVVRRRSGRAERIARLEPGTRAIVEGPYGDLDRVAVPAGRRVALVGAGAGVTPLRALAADLAGAGHDVVAVHRARSEAEQVLGDDLRALAAAGAITLHEVIGARAAPGADPLDAPGLAKLIPDLADRELVICSPPELTARLVHAATALGVAPQLIHVGVFAL